MDRIDLATAMDTVDLTEEQRQELVTLVDAMNEKMRASGAGGSEAAFGLGCAIGLIPVVGVTLLLLAFRVINLVLASFFLVVGSLVVAGVSTLMANVARKNTHQRIFRDQVEPEIDEFIRRYHLSRQRFGTLAHESLPEDAPLQAFFSLTIPEAERSPGKMKD